MTRILLVMCCVFEVVLCYQYVGLCWGDREDVRTAEKVVYTLTALFLGVFAARQRGYFLLAYPVVLVLSVRSFAFTFCLEETDWLYRSLSVFFTDCAVR